MSQLQQLLELVSLSDLEVITGNMLGDGSVAFSHGNTFGVGNGSARYQMNVKADAYPYIKDLFESIYGQFSGTGPKPWPNTALPQHEGKRIMHYNFNTLSLPLFTLLHSMWYRYDTKKKQFVKILPSYLDDLFTPVVLAYLIMDDGCRHGSGIVLCTESFTHEENLRLIRLLAKLGILATIQRRDVSKGHYRVRISTESMTLVRKLVTPHIHPYFMYKLGPSGE